MLKNLARTISIQLAEIGLAGSAFINTALPHSTRAEGIPELLSSKVPNMLINLNLGISGFRESAENI